MTISPMKVTDILFFLPDGFTGKVLVSKNLTLL